MAFDQSMERVEELLRTLQAQAPDQAPLARDLIQALLDVHRSGLERLVGILERHQVVAKELMEDLVADPQVSSLLILHDAHPQSPDVRVRAALQRLDPYLKANGLGQATLRGWAGGEAIVFLRGTTSEGSNKVQVAVEEALLSAAPDIERVRFEFEKGTNADGNARRLRVIP